MNLFHILSQDVSDIYILFEKGTRGRICYISNRYNKTKNKYLKPYDTKQESKHIHLDTNNLYGYACLSFFQQVDSNE